LEDFLLVHDLGESLKGAFPPGLLLLRDGLRMRVATAAREWQLDFADTMDTLQSLAACILARTETLDDARSTLAWKRSGEPVAAMGRRCARPRPWERAVRRHRRLGDSASADGARQLTGSALASAVRTNDRAGRAVAGFMTKATVPVPAPGRSAAPWRGRDVSGFAGLAGPRAGGFRDPLLSSRLRQGSGLS